MSESGFSRLKDFQDSVPDALVHLAPAGRHVYRTVIDPFPKPQIPGGLSVNLWFIEPSTLCKVPGIFDMCPVSESLIKQMTQIAQIIVRIRILPDKSGQAGLKDFQDSKWR